MLRPAIISPEAGQTIGLAGGGGGQRMETDKLETIVHPAPQSGCQAISLSPHLVGGSKMYSVSLQKYQSIQKHLQLQIKASLSRNVMKDIKATFSRPETRQQTEAAGAPLVSQPHTRAEFVCIKVKL